MKGLGGDKDGYGEDEEVFVYHYGKPGERLKNADETVRKFYAGEGPQPPKGIFKSLVQTPSSRLMLSVVLALLAIVSLSSIMNRGRGNSVGPVPMKLSAFSFEDTVYVSLHLLESQDAGFSEPVPVSCSFLFYITDQQVVHREEMDFFYSGKEEFLRTSFGDYDILYVESEVTVGQETKTFRSEITRS